MSNESQQQIAREAADGIFDKPDLQHLIKGGMTRLEFRSIATQPILSAIERATEAIYAKSEEPRCDFVSHMQPQHREQQEWSIVQIEAPPIAAYDLCDGSKCLDVNLDYKDAKTLKEAINAALAAERQLCEQQGKAYERLKVDYARRLSKALGLSEQLMSARVAIEKTKAYLSPAICKPLESVDLSPLYEHDRELTSKIKDEFRPTIRRIHDIATRFGWKGSETQDALSFIAEVRKPLVDALEDGAHDCEDVSRDAAVGVGEKRAWIAVARKLRSALAKVKEGK